MIESWLAAISAAVAPGNAASAGGSARAAIPFLTWETIERLLDRGVTSIDDAKTWIAQRTQRRLQRLIARLPSSPSS
jgi:hypothetical protein